MRFPHARGDVPRNVHQRHVDGEFSPRSWGCSAPFETPPKHVNVFPTLVGMFRCSRRWQYDLRRFPHARGDVPML